MNRYVFGEGPRSREKIILIELHLAGESAAIEGVVQGKGRMGMKCAVFLSLGSGSNSEALSELNLHQLKGHCLSKALNSCPRWKVLFFVLLF